MKKVISTVFLVLMAGILVYGIPTADAKVTGVCSNCHTMHNSQDLNAVAKVWSGGALTTTGNPLGVLMNGDCVACHSRSDSQTIDPVTNAPIVYNTGAYPASPLAGGNFKGGADNSTYHNVTPIFTSSRLATPPGFKALTAAAKPAGFSTSGTGWGPSSWSGQVTCGGTTGCHGDRSSNGTSDFAALRGAHHSNDMTTAKDGTTVAKSFRFLAGIQGAEASNYEQTVSSTAHNGYFGDATGASTNTIGYLCAECHAQFHRNTTVNSSGATDVGTGSPWLRHPVDVALAASNGSPFTTDYSVYNPVVPVAFATNNTANETSSAVSSANVVVCQSCHRAHGSPYAKLLRFDYTTVSAGNGTSNGCLQCHQRQR